MRYPTPEANTVGSSRGEPVARSRLRSQRGWGTGLVLVLACGIFQSPALAETLYVTDILRLGLHRASDTSDSPFRTLVSGDELEVLEKTRFYARVRTTDGQVGWVKASYLVDEKPAQSRLADLTGERDALAQQLTSMGTRLQSQNAELESLRSERDQLNRQLQETTTEAGELRVSNQRLNERVAETRFSVPMRWVILTALAMLALGLVAGWWWCDWKYRQRHGGFRL